jgi:RNA polymerase sigma-70 factor (ECF subfamily)
MAATARAIVTPVRPFHGDSGGGLRGSRAKTTIFPLPLRERFSFDQDYVRRLIAEDPETERHFTEYFGDLLTLKLRSKLRSQAQVEDVRQETFMRVLTALKKKGSLASPESLGAFVKAVCNNVLLETYRSGGRTTALDDEMDEPEAGEPSVEWRVLKAEERVKVRAAIAGLPPRDRDLIRWLFFEDRDKDDVCRELQVDRDYLRVLFHRAKQRFRERFSSGEQHT